IFFLSCLIILFLIGCLGIYFLKKDSADGRAFIWKISIQTILHNPLGVGIGNFSGTNVNEQAKYFKTTNGSELEQHVADSPEYAFNEYLQICIEHGIIPFLIFISVIGYSIYIGVKRKQTAALSSLIALLIAALMSYLFSVLPFLIVLVFLLALIHLDASAKAIKIRLFMPQVVFTIIVFACLYNRYPTYQSYKQWHNASYSYHSGSYNNAVKEYAQLYPQLSDQIKFLFEYAQCLSKTEQYESSNQILRKAISLSGDPMLYNIMGKNHQGMKQYSEAEQCFRKAAHIVPNRIYPYYLLTLLYIETGDSTKAKETAKIVLTKEPKVKSTAVREMREKVKEIL
ncbi:MAG: O-antigen ligase family protein, partial [Tannerellaceae bacterium]|nr:O-antigen ligase family protein [Tannerellaceae bacterium]